MDVEVDQLGGEGEVEEHGESREPVVGVDQVALPWLTSERYKPETLNPKP